uniref:Glucuronosyltransferase n=1 Tax=Heterorhabditis bacteriophora TaxID=37862 RepID=A0A1I7WF04_HETBA
MVLALIDDSIHYNSSRFEVIRKDLGIPSGKLSHSLWHNPGPFEDSSPLNPRILRKLLRVSSLFVEACKDSVSFELLISKMSFGLVLLLYFVLSLRLWELTIRSAMYQVNDFDASRLLIKRILFRPSAHPNYLAIITHGGWSSILESLLHGINDTQISPIDHAKNAKVVESKAVGILVDKMTVNENRLVSAIKEITTQLRYGV